eukprot:2133013-Pyramimonas_sp.AAC.1
MGERTEAEGQEKASRALHCSHPASWTRATAKAGLDQIHRQCVDHCLLSTQTLYIATTSSRIVDASAV